MSARNLIIVINPRLLDYRDFEEIGRMINARNSDIRFSLLSFDDDIANFPSIDWRLPTFTVSLSPEVRSTPKRGMVFFNRQVDKLAQLKILHDSGVSVPVSASFDPHHFYDPRQWGDFVIVKSRSFEGSSKGATAYLTPSAYLTTPEIYDDPVKSILINGNAIIQEFIPTGQTAISHRVCTFLGRVIYQMADVAPLALPKLDPKSTEIHLFDSKFQDHAQGLVRQRILHKDLQIIEFGQRVAKAFPGIPLLGIDVVKNEVTGALYALEVNAGGNTWHFSSPVSAEGRKFISREERINQFGAWDIVANVLIEKTLYYAK